jgi:ribulose-5-phosphate 4-epimerase/fuculose-1-phosphate aldolase
MSVIAMPSPHTPSMRHRVSKAEWETRVQLAAMYRIAAHQGLEDLTYNHFTARVPDARNHFLI